MVDPLGKNVPPAIDKTAFNCPHCGTKTTQFWHAAYADPIEAAPQVQVSTIGGGTFPRLIETPVRLFEVGENAQYVKMGLRNTFISTCMECGDFALWFGSRMILPRATAAPAAHVDMPDVVKEDYDEARRILSLSPRGAAALLRLAVEKLCIDLGYETGNVNAKIKKMVDDGLPHAVERALDVVRVIGNNAVHPGYLDLKDDLDTATQLFGIMNYIVMDRITRPNELEKLFATNVSEGAKVEIAKRRKNPEDSES